MFHRRPVLESSSVDLPQRDKDRLLVMSVGGNDLFDPNARKVQEWKKDTEEDKVKLLSRVFVERESRDRAARKKPSSVHPPRSLSHHSPMDAIPTARSKDSYQRPLGQSFRRYSKKQSSYRPRQSSSSKGKSSAKDKKPASQQYRSSSGVQSGGQGSARKDKDKIKGLSSLATSTKKGGAEVENNENRTDSLPVGGKLALCQSRWLDLFPQFPEIIPKISQGNLIVFSDAVPTILHRPLELHSKIRPSDLL